MSFSEKSDETCLSGIVVRVTYDDPKGLFSVVRLRLDDQSVITLVGSLSGLSIGQRVSCQGQWKRSASYGDQFAVTSFFMDVPTENLEEMIHYLGSGNLPGIGPVLAAKIVEKFGKETPFILDHRPDQLSIIRGITPQKAEQIHQAWKKQRDLCNLMVFCQKIGLSTRHTKKIHDKWGLRSEEVIRGNPYILVREIWGFGFKRADQVAQHLGLAQDAPVRIQAAYEAIISQSHQEGHTCLPKGHLLEEAQRLLQLNERSALEKYLEHLLNEGRLLQDLKEGSLGKEPFIWSALAYRTEQNIASQLDRLLQSPSRIPSFDLEGLLQKLSDQLGMTLADAQKEAVRMTYTHKVHILTGGPGTGKSTITRCLAWIGKQLGLDLICCAPTGKAAKRLGEASGHPSKTIHHLLEYDFASQTFQKTENAPLEADLVIVDEMSMVDSFLFHHLLKAIPCHAHLVLVGDRDQLASIGPGQVLEDLISSRRLPICTLSVLFRQSERSGIVQAAHLIQSGRSPLIQESPDFSFIEEQDGQRIVERICFEVYERLPRLYKLDPQEEVQVLCPMRKGPVGIERLNTALQQTFQKGQAGSFSVGSRTFFLGDKLIQTRNNYRKEIFNGSIHFLRYADLANQTCELISMEGRSIIYRFDELDQLQHAYALSVHKYQGSEAECIVMPIHPSHSIMLFRRLLYTAITRARQYVLLIGSRKHLWYCVRNQGQTARFTGLRRQLEEKWPPRPLRI
ncbi:ATP-dependent RecD-like DNA helicase [Candidatus Similichlamydia laticola]|uniref:ATP-dependent RecD2 DNA helicase n=1 Tax=Candidatus Similichlamydia laticola TaxID=2170265 RepID=A0A369KFS5_9BACT|nr:ATP-dependent RecD-like DNA helicase [Candidatus Similichlamydia laticola]RDB31757.1 RecD-like DNA helicase YrrC [Candidatus Similichlamydia laticola]